MVRVWRRNQKPVSPSSDSMNDLFRYAKRPLAFIGHYVRRRWQAHVVMLIAVLGAVGCSVGTQYGLKHLIDTLAAGPDKAYVLSAFVILAALISADMLLWRFAGWIGSVTFVGVTGDLRRELFRYLTGHAAAYFLDRQPGVLTSRITATSNAVYTIEHMFMSNVLPPCIATVGAILVILSVSLPMAGVLVVVAGVVIAVMFRLAAAGRPLHHNYADKAAAVDGEMVDVVSNMPLVRAFCGLPYELRRFDRTVEHEMSARRHSLLHLEKLRLLHAAITVLLAAGLLAWAIALWRNGAATTGDVVLVCTLGLTVLHATRDLAVALVDVTQHMARLAEGLATLLVPQALPDHPEAVPLVSHYACVDFEHLSFSYPDGRRVFTDFNLKVDPGQRVGLLGPSGIGKSTLFALLQRLYALQGGRILIDGQDISRLTQDSVRGAISVVPQDVSLFHRSAMENIRYGRPEASGEEVFRAAEAARCDEFIAGLPEGYDTIVGDRGVKLSGGQRQRIAIARAFLKDASILLLDEATSALDVESEEMIRDALNRLMRGRTVIAIDHNLRALRGFDRIVMLQDGRVAQDGAPEHLMERDGLYREWMMRELHPLSRRAA
jgi:ATP-binding cassette subfamily B protein